MTALFGRLPPVLQREVVQQAIFLHALRLAITSHDPRSLTDQAAELRSFAANGLSAVKYVRLAAGDADWHDCAKVAAIQSLAAAAGGHLLDAASRALRHDEHTTFVAQTRHAFGLPPRTPASNQQPNRNASTGPRPARQVPIAA